MLKSVWFTLLYKRCHLLDRLNAWTNGRLVLSRVFFPHDTCISQIQNVSLDCENGLTWQYVQIIKFCIKDKAFFKKDYQKKRYSS